MRRSLPGIAVAAAICGAVEPAITLGEIERELPADATEFQGRHSQCTLEDQGAAHAMTPACDQCHWARNGSAHCSLQDQDAAHAVATECVRCHRTLTSHSHPVDVSYEEAQLRRPSASLRPVQDVVARGVPLEGVVRCALCHDAASSLPDKLVLPSSRLCVACHAFN
jgi:predicted CXXCH cytochrome family protein